MDSLRPRALKAQADDAMKAASYNSRKLVVIHVGVTILLSLVLMLLDWVLEQGVGSTGGLSGMGNRAVLRTIQSVLQLGQSVVLPFWQAGWVLTSLRLYRRQQVAPKTLACGFFAFGPVLRMLLAEGVIIMAVSMIAAYIGAFVFLMTPWAEPLMLAVMDPAMTEATLLAAVEAVTVPMTVICMIVMLIAVLPVLFFLRQSMYLLMWQPRAGAFRCMLGSVRMMGRRIWVMLRLDLSFWWFYALEALCVLLSFGNVVLQLCGITLGAWADYAFMLTSSAAQLTVYVLFKARVDVTYAAAFQELLPPHWRMAVTEGHYGSARY